MTAKSIGRYPGGKRFAFTVIDDTDNATLANVKPLYDFLHALGMRVTKTVWPMACPEGSPNFGESETLEDPRYLEFVRELKARGFEITWHGATMESSTRERTLAALELYFERFGEYPRIHVNHSQNRENVYWGAARFDSPVLQFFVSHVLRRPLGHFSGDDPKSPYWWGDRCQRHMEYGRNLTTNNINTASFNPSMPYRDPQRPLIPWWFSSSDADNVDEFNALIAEPNQEQLEREQGFCIVATHFGKRFVENGQVNPLTRERLSALARRDGWFPTTGELLDWLRTQRPAGAPETLPPGEWRRMQRQWAVELILRKLLSRIRPSAKPSM